MQYIPLIDPKKFNKKMPVFEVVRSDYVSVDEFCERERYSKAWVMEIIERSPDFPGLYHEDEYLIAKDEIGKVSNRFWQLYNSNPSPW